MPQLILEFSANVIEKNNIDRLLQQCHLILAEKLPTDIETCKSRSVECTSYYIGNGEPNNAFVHLTLKVLQGRSFETLKATGDSMMEVLKNYYIDSLKNLNLQITIEISELAKTYFHIESA